MENDIKKFEAGINLDTNLNVDNSSYKVIPIDNPSNDDDKIIEDLKNTVASKDLYTRSHLDRVSKYSVLIGEKLGLSDDDLNNLQLGALFHDIGKVEIPDSILKKESRLTDIEYTQMQHHPSIGVNILSSSGAFSKIIPIVEHHHEKYDGNGYPSRLKGNDIPYLARITAIADTFDAMTSNRSYRDALSKEVVIDEFKKFKRYSV